MPDEDSKPPAQSEAQSQASEEQSNQVQKQPDPSKPDKNVNVPRFVMLFNSHREEDQK
jgi:hypothetical protein